MVSPARAIGCLLVAGLVGTLVDGRVSAGAQQSAWEGDNECGEPVAGGVSLVRLDALGAGRVAERLLVRLERWARPDIGRTRRDERDPHVAET